MVRTARLQLEVTDPQATYDAAVALTADAGGYVSGANLSRAADGALQGQVTLRVPTEQLTELVVELDALAVAVPERRIDEADVTGELADLEAQLVNLRRYEIELQGLLADVRGETTARSQDLLAVFEQLRSVRGDIERLEAQQRGRIDQVTYATLQLTIRPHATVSPVTDATWSAKQTLRDAWTATVATGRGVVDATIWFTVAVLPFLLVPSAAAYALRRRRRRTRSAETAAPPDPPLPRR